MYDGGLCIGGGWEFNRVAFDPGILQRSRGCYLDLPAHTSADQMVITERLRVTHVSSATIVGITPLWGRFEFLDGTAPCA